MKSAFLLFSLFLCCIIQAQDFKPTNEFTIDGDVKNKFTFSLKDSAGFTSHAIDSFLIVHSKDRKRVVKNIKGILLKDILGKAVLNEEKPKLFSEFYFTCIATDGFKIVYSWNELFNTGTGDGVLIVTEIDGKKADGLGENIVSLSLFDKAAGRRYVKNLQEIRVERVK